LEADVTTVNREENSGHDAVILTPTDELLTAAVVQEVQSLSNSSATKHVVLDLRAIRSLVSSSLYPDAAPFTPLLRFHEQLKQEERQLVLCSLSSEMAKLFRMTRLDQIFEIQSDTDAALAVLPKG